MTWLKKLKPEWNPQEHPGILVGDIVDFPGNVQRLVEEESAILCDETGSEVSTFDTLGVMTQRELDQFRAWREQENQESLKKSLESEQETLLAQAQEVRSQIANQAPVTPAPAVAAAPTGTVEDAKIELEQKKKEFGAKMAAARAAKAAERAAQQEAPVSA